MTPQPPSMSSPGPDLSICTTSYNNAPTIVEHLDSIYRELDGLHFEYLVVDSRSTDGTDSVFLREAEFRRDLRVVSKRCSRGIGREIAARLARAGTIVTVDADTVYWPVFGTFVRRYLSSPRLAGYGLQAVYGGIFPKDLWEAVGGMRNLNYGEDLDLWMRIHERGRMLWTPVLLGENRKDPTARDRFDALSEKYPKGERVLRLARRELDFWKLREYWDQDLEETRRRNTIDLHLGDLQERWLTREPPWTLARACRRFGRDLISIARS